MNRITTLALLCLTSPLLFSSDELMSRKDFSSQEEYLQVLELIKEEDPNLYEKILRRDSGSEFPLPTYPSLNDFGDSNNKKPFTIDRSRNDEKYFEDLLANPLPLNSGFSPLPNKPHLDCFNQHPQQQKRPHYPSNLITKKIIREQLIDTLDKPKQEKPSFLIKLNDSGAKAQFVGRETLLNFPDLLKTPQSFSRGEGTRKVTIGSVLATGNRVLNQLVQSYAKQNQENDPSDDNRYILEINENGVTALVDNKYKALLIGISKKIIYQYKRGDAVVPIELYDTSMKKKMDLSGIWDNKQLRCRFIKINSAGNAVSCLFENEKNELLKYQINNPREGNLDEAKEIINFIIPATEYKEHDLSEHPALFDNRGNWLKASRFTDLKDSFNQPSTLNKGDLALARQFNN